MSLLELEHVGKRVREGQRERIVLADVELHIDPGELVVVWGTRRSGKTTLLRVAAGIQAPDTGTAYFDGQDLAHVSAGVLGAGIGYVQRTLRAGEEQGVLEQVAAAPLANGLDVPEAMLRARAALARAGAERCAEMRVGELRGGESVRVALARALVLSPRLLIIDEPAAAVELDERDGILALLRRLAGDGIAVLASTGEPSELAGAHRPLTLSDGQLRGERVAGLAPVVALRRAGL